ncbi:hypothetical protein H671_2g8120 [Cricetulus griseus]|nr:hypothetical protein H671_2g8120 [Cricetulus griseus]
MTWATQRSSNASGVPDACPPRNPSGFRRAGVCTSSDRHATCKATENELSGLVFTLAASLLTFQRIHSELLMNEKNVTLCLCFKRI